MRGFICLQKFLVFLVLVGLSTQTWSYGGGGGGSSCKEPSFKNMTPPKSTVVEPGAEFSFTASSNTNPKSIKVVVKGQEVDLQVEKNGAIKVTGNLPPELTDGYARINITASSSPSSCQGEGGWLLKIGE